jgi:hypothetical protein
MKRWLRCGLLAALLVALVVGVPFEFATHVGRGWLRGDAFFDGRPTSYWRRRCDEFLDRAERPIVAAAFVPQLVGAEAKPNDPDFQTVFLSELYLRPPPRSMWRRLQDFLGMEENDWSDRQIPEVLSGTPEAEAVLLELAADEKYKILTARGLRNVKVFKELPP